MYIKIIYLKSIPWSLVLILRKKKKIINEITIPSFYAALNLDMKKKKIVNSFLFTNPIFSFKLLYRKDTEKE